MPDPSTQLGAKLGPRLAELMSKAMVTTTAQLTPHKVAGGMLLQERFFRLVAGEVRSTVAPLTRDLAEDPDITPWLKQTLGFMANGTGQWATILNFTGVGSALGGSLGGLIENEMRPAVEKRFAANPNAVHAPETLARLVATRLMTLREGMAEAHKSALSQYRFNQLVRGAESVPGVGELITLVQRGHLTLSDLKTYLQRAGINDQLVAAIPELRRALLTPEELANLVDRGEVSRDDARDVANRWGYRAADFDLMVRLVGVPPATELLLMAYRRGIIDKARLDRGIRQSPLRSEWIDVISQLQYDPLLTTQAADAVSQNLMSRERGREIANDNGMRSADFDMLVTIAGRPPGIEQMLELWNRGEATESEVKQALLESPLKNKWVPMIMKTRRRIPPQDTVRMLINRGLLTPAEGIRKFMAVGFDAKDAHALAELAQADKTETDRDLTKAEILSAYEVRLLTRDATAGMLDSLGYDRNEQDMIIALSDARRAKREMDAAASVIRSKFVAHKITDNEAVTYLDALHVPPDARDHLLAIWALERDANQRELTPAEIINMTKAGLIDRGNAKARLLALGYSDGDAELKLALVFGPA